jgi:Uma2 family endonuclease
MSTTAGTEGPEMLTDLLERLGGISPARVVSNPPPGTATEKDLLGLMRRTGRLYELVDGTLVEKAMGYDEGSLALWLGFLLQSFLEKNDLGNLAGADSTMRLMAGLVRVPDISFVRWEKLPKRRAGKPIPDLVPDLAVEILSRGNTRGEIQRKLKEYFLAGTELAWVIDPDKRTVAVHTSPDEKTTLTEGDTLDGGTVLPGLSLAVRRVFERLPPARAGEEVPLVWPRQQEERARVTVLAAPAAAAIVEPDPIHERLQP